MIGSDRVTACFSSLSEGQCGVDEALHCFGGIIKECMKKALGVSNNKVCPTGARMSTVRMRNIGFVTHIGRTRRVCKL